MRCPNQLDYKIDAFKRYPEAKQSVQIQDCRRSCDETSESSVFALDEIWLISRLLSTSRALHSYRRIASVAPFDCKKETQEKIAIFFWRR